MTDPANEEKISETGVILTDNKSATETISNDVNVVVPIKERIIYKITEKTEALYGKTE